MLCMYFFIHLGNNKDKPHDYNSDSDEDSNDDDDDNTDSPGELFHMISCSKYIAECPVMSLHVSC